MTFLAPLGLVALASLPVIVLLHLVQQRRRSVRVPSLELWSSAGAPPQRKPRRLPLSLLLLLHLLVAALLGLSLGRPFLMGTAFEPVQTTVVLDTSGSMAANDSGNSSRFADAQAAARSIFTSARQGDRIALVTLGTPARLLGQGGPEAASSLLAELAALRPAGSDGDIAGAINLATAVTHAPDGNDIRQRIVVLTDGSFGPQVLANTPLTAAAEVDWRTFGQPGDNVAIVAFAARPVREGGHRLYARVANLGDAPAARDLQVMLDGTPVETEPIRLDGGAEAEWSWPLPAGARLAEASLTSGDVLGADDRAAAVLTGGRRLRVQLVSTAATPLERALRAQSNVDVAVMAATDYRHDPTADIAVLVGFVPPALPPVPTLFVAPPAESGILETNGAERNLRANAAGDSRFAAIDLSAVVFSNVAAITMPDWATAALSADDAPLVITGVLENQPRTVWTFDPSTSNMAGRLAFPLLTAASLRTLAPQADTSRRIGETTPEELVAPDGSTLAANSVLSEPGVYQRVGQTESIAVNTLDARESDLRSRAAPTISETISAQSVVTREGSRQLWRYILTAAVFLLVVEWLYAHRRSRGRSTRPTSRVGTPRGTPRTSP
jgi:Ca-activated chloride channel family protein